MPFIETSDKTSLYYNDWGAGRPVVLIHGWPLDADMWEYQSVALAEAGYRVIAYDRRGFGRSSQPWTGYDYDTMAGDLNTIMETLDLHDAALCGFSMGGGEVARYLGRYGASRVAKAVLVSAVTPYLLKTAEHSQGADKSIFDEMIAGLRNDRPHFLAGFGKKFFGANILNFSVSSDLLQWAQSLALLASPKATLDCVRAFSETDFRQDMKSFTMPTLIVHGDADQTVPAEVSAHEAAKMIPHAELKIYPGAPHALVVTEHARFNADLLRFLAS